MTEDEFIELLDAVKSASEKGHEYLDGTIYSFGSLIEMVLFVFQQQQYEIDDLKRYIALVKFAQGKSI